MTTAKPRCRGSIWRIARSAIFVRASILSLHLSSLFGFSTAILAQPPIVVNNLTELRLNANTNNATIVMAPGEYFIGKNGSDRTLLRLNGNNTIYDFSQATFKVDTRNFAGFGGGHENTVNVVGLYGAGATLTGLNLEAVHVALDTAPNAQRWSDAPATNMLRIAGSNNRLENSSIIARGSNTYGYGDAFGKGGAPCSGCANIGPRKGLGVQILGASGTTQIDGLDLQMRAFGHGIYVQQTTGLVDIRNTNVIGEMTDSQAIINHPVYQATITAQFPNGRTHYGPAMWAGIQISKSEDGIRAYGDASADFYLENTVVENMREAYSLFSTTGIATVVNAAAWNNETGFEPGPGDTILNSQASATNGPVLYMRNNAYNDIVAEIEIHGDMPQPGRDWSVAIISGERNDIKLTKGDIAPGALSADALVRISQEYIDWRHLPGLQSTPTGNGRTTRNLSIVNTTGQNMMIATPAMTGSNDFDITSGNVLGGNGTIFTSIGTSDVDLRIQSGGKLDPMGTLSFSIGFGELELFPGINSADSQALLFELNGESNSDKVQMNSFSRLNIGSSVLELDDFLFSIGEDFGGGTFTLFESVQTIVGTLGSKLTGLIAGMDAELSMSSDARSILLTVASPVTLAGDYNNDGVVDAADYTVWRNSLGGPGLLNETALPLGIADEADYFVWKSQYGMSNSMGAGGLTTIPEPANLAMATLVSLILGSIASRRPLGDTHSNGF